VLSVVKCLRTPVIKIPLVVENVEPALCKSSATLIFRQKMNIPEPAIHQSGCDLRKSILVLICMANNDVFLMSRPTLLRHQDRSCGPAACLLVTPECVSPVCLVGPFGRGSFRLAQQKKLYPMNQSGNCEMSMTKDIVDWPSDWLPACYFRYLASVWWCWASAKARRSSSPRPGMLLNRRPPVRRPVFRICVRSSRSEGLPTMRHYPITTGLCADSLALQENGRPR
jgi:hypothetical protein